MLAVFHQSICNNSNDVEHGCTVSNSPSQSHNEINQRFRFSIRPDKPRGLLVKYFIISLLMFLTSSTQSHVTEGSQNTSGHREAAFHKTAVESVPGSRHSHGDASSSPVWIKPWLEESLWFFVWPLEAGGSVSTDLCVKMNGFIAEINSSKYTQFAPLTRLSNIQKANKRKRATALPPSGWWCNFKVKIIRHKDKCRGHA